jgi:hypothetical protein
MMLAQERWVALCSRAARLAFVAKRVRWDRLALVVAAAASQIVVVAEPLERAWAEAADLAHAPAPSKAKARRTNTLMRGLGST